MFQWDITGSHTSFFLDFDQLRYSHSLIKTNQFASASAHEAETFLSFLITFGIQQEHLCFPGGALCSFTHSLRHIFITHFFLIDMWWLEILLLYNKTKLIVFQSTFKLRVYLWLFFYLFIILDTLGTIYVHWWNCIKLIFYCDTEVYIFRYFFLHPIALLDSVSTVKASWGTKLNSFSSTVFRYLIAGQNWKTWGGLTVCNIFLEQTLALFLHALCKTLENGSLAIWFKLE